jgi:hypothetical protein
MAQYHDEHENEYDLRAKQAKQNRSEAMNMKKIAEAARLEDKAARLREEAFNERPLPDFWRVGQTVRLIRSIEFGYDAGQTAQVVEVRDPTIPASEYQVFWISQRPKQERFWTTPADVELVEDVPATIGATDGK